MSSEIAVLAIVDVIGHLRMYLGRRECSVYDAVPYRLDGHQMLQMLSGIESHSVALMQQRTAQVLAALELGYLHKGPTLRPQPPRSVGWLPIDTVRLVAHLPGFLKAVRRYRDLLQLPED